MDFGLNEASGPNQRIHFWSSIFEKTGLCFVRDESVEKQRPCLFITSQNECCLKKMKRKTEATKQQRHTEAWLRIRRHAPFPGMETSRTEKKLISELKINSSFCSFFLLLEKVLRTELGINNHWRLFFGHRVAKYLRRGKFFQTVF